MKLIHFPRLKSCKCSFGIAARWFWKFKVTYLNQNAHLSWSCHVHILTLPSTLNNFLFPQLQRSAPQLVSAYVIHDDDVAHAPHASSAWVAFISGSAKNGSTHFACLIFNLPMLCKTRVLENLAPLDPMKMSIRKCWKNVDSTWSL